MAINQLNLPQIYQAAQQTKALERQNMLAQMQMDQLRSQIDAGNRMKELAGTYRTNVGNGMAPSAARESFFNEGIGVDLDQTGKTMELFRSMDESQRKQAAEEMERVGRMAAAANSPEEWDAMVDQLGPEYAEYRGQYGKKSFYLSQIANVKDLLGFGPTREYTSGDQVVTEEKNILTGEVTEVGRGSKYSPKARETGEPLKPGQVKTNEEIRVARESLRSWIADWEITSGNKMTPQELVNITRKTDEYGAVNEKFSPTARKMLFDSLKRMNGDDPEFEELYRSLTVPPPQVTVEQVMAAKTWEEIVLMAKHPNRDLYPPEVAEAIAERLEGFRPDG